MDKPKFPYYTKFSDLVVTRDLYNRVMKKHNISKSQLKYPEFHSLIIELNKEIGNWILENPEGFKLPDMGYLIISKRQNKPYFQDAEKKCENIDNVPGISDLRKSILKSRYKYNDERNELKYKQYTPYIYKLMWFNKKNCFNKKCDAYFFEPLNNIKNKIKDSVKEERVNYTNHNFHEYYMPHYKLKD